MPDRKKRMVIFLEGGLIQSIISDSKMDVYVLDGDIEGGDEDRIIDIKGAYCIPPEESNIEKFFLGGWDIEAEPKRTEFFVKQIKEQEK